MIEDLELIQDAVKRVEIITMMAMITGLCLGASITMSGFTKLPYYLFNYLEQVAPAKRYYYCLTQKLCQ
tara:strand:- start:6155 stop:6361 length:207 start_codon:yes stop_codon:yes gene_type:complete